MKIIIIHIELLADTEKHFNDLTDQEVLDLCAQDKDMENHSVYDSVEQLSADFNTDEMFDSHNAYMRVIQEQEDPKYKSFPITSVCRADLENKGFDISEVDDDTMEQLADRLSDDYCEQFFWSSMETIASEALSIPRMPVQIKDVEHLKEMIEDDNHDFYIALKGGGRSSKCIDYEPESEMFTIENEIDGTEQELTEQQLFDEDYTNIGKAIKVGSLYAYQY